MRFSVGSAAMAKAKPVYEKRTKRVRVGWHGTCDYCSAPFTRSRKARFCQSLCRSAYWNRQYSKKKAPKRKRGAKR